jgi:hypothetical protein
MSAAAQPPLDPNAVIPPVETPPPNPELAAIQQKLTELQASAAEQTRATQYWYDKANEKVAPAKVAPVEDDDTDVLELLTSKGAKGLDELLDKRGFVRKSDMESTVNSKASQVTAETQLVKQYPDLADNKSEFFQSVSENYAALIKEGVKPVLATQMAARETERQFLLAGKIKTPAQKTEETKQQKEAERQARVKAQAGDRGGRAPQAEEEDDEVTPEERRIAINIIKEDGMTDDQAVEAYKARAKKGVAMRGIPRR